MEQMDLYDLMEEDQHDPEIQYRLGLCYLHGYGTQKDPGQADLWLKRAAEQGHSQALALVGETRQEAPDDGITGQTLPQWCLKAEDGDPEAQYAVACYFTRVDEGKYRAEIARYLEEAAEQGHGQACLLLGRQHMEAENYSAAVLYLNRACECNLSQAAEKLSYCYFHGAGVAKDEEKAEQLLQRAADWGDGEANFRIALRYALGRDIPVSQVKAMAYVEKARQAGMENARERFDAQLEAYRQAQAAKIERERRLEEERRRTEEQERLRKEQAQKEAARQAYEQQQAREKWKKEHLEPMTKALQAGQEKLALAQLRNHLRPNPIIGLVAGVAVFWLAWYCNATQTQAWILGIGFAVAVTAMVSVVRKKIKPLDTRQLEQEIARTQAQLEAWEKEDGR